MRHLSIELHDKFIRNTHDSNGNYRRDMGEMWDKIPGVFSGIIHLLNSTEPITVLEIMKEEYKFAAEFPVENSADIYCNMTLLKPILQLLMNFDMIRKVDDE